MSLIRRLFWKQRDELGLLNELTEATFWKKRGASSEEAWRAKKSMAHLQTIEKQIPYNLECVFNDFASYNG